MSLHVELFSWEPGSLISIAWITDGQAPAHWVDTYQFEDLNKATVTFDVEIPECKIGWNLNGNKPAILRMRSGRFYGDASGDTQKQTTMDLSQREVRDLLPLRVNVDPWLIRLSKGH